MTRFRGTKKSLTVPMPVNQKPGYIPEAQKAKYQGVSHPPLDEQKRVGKKR